MTANQDFVIRTWRNLNIPISPGSLVTLGYPHPMTEAEWEQFAAVWATMKPGVVASDSEETMVEGQEG